MRLVWPGRFSQVSFWSGIMSVLTPPGDVSAIKTYEKAGFTAGETFLWLDFNSAA